MDKQRGKVFLMSKKPPPSSDLMKSLLRLDAEVDRILGIKPTPGVLKGELYVKRRAKKR